MELKEILSSLQEEIELDNLYWARKRAVDIIQKLDEIRETEHRERKLSYLAKNYPELPLTKDRFGRFQRKYHKTIGELNALFGKFSLEFRRFSVGGGRQIEYTRNGMSINDANEAVNAPKEMEHHSGNARRILKYSFHPGNGWDGDSAVITEVELITADKIDDNLGKIEVE